MGFGAGSVGLFLGDESEGRTGDNGRENAEDKRYGYTQCLDLFHSDLVFMQISTYVIRLCTVCPC